MLIAKKESCYAGAFLYIAATVRFEAERNREAIVSAMPRVRALRHLCSRVSALLKILQRLSNGLDGGFAPGSILNPGKGSLCHVIEHTFLARQDVTAQQVTGLMNTYKAVIEEHGGKVGKTEYWGLKSTPTR